MARIRKTTKVSSGYTQIHNSCFRGALSPVAMAILGYGLSHVDGWEFERADLNTVWSGVGKFKIDKALTELRCQGYVEVTKTRDTDGCFVWEWDFTPDPLHAASRAAANPNGDIVDKTSTKPQVTPQPTDQGVDSPAKTSVNGQTGAKPDPGEPALVQRGSGSAGSGLNKEEKTTKEEQQPPPSPPASGQATVVVQPEGGEDGNDKPQPSPVAVARHEADAKAIWVSVLSARTRQHMGDDQKAQLFHRLRELLVAGVTVERAQARLEGVDKADYPFAAACKRLSGLETELDNPTDQVDVFAPEPGSERPVGTVPAHCGSCSGGPRGKNEGQYRRVFNADGTYGGRCPKCHPDFFIPSSPQE